MGTALPGEVSRVGAFVVSTPGWALNWLRQEHLESVATIVRSTELPTNRHIQDNNLLTSSYVIFNRQRYNFHFQINIINNDQTLDIKALYKIWYSVAC